MDAYLTAKWLHILSSAVLLGTGIGTAFMMIWAMRSDTAQIIHHTAAGAVVAGALFSAPALLVQAATGLWLIHLQGYPLTEPWLLLTYALYVLAFVTWLPVVGLQIRMRTLTAGAASVPPLARRAYGLWCALGWPGFLALAAIFWLMVRRPPLWG